jgi:hypothetical protein
MQHLFFTGKKSSQNKISEFFRKKNKNKNRVFGLTKLCDFFIKGLDRLVFIKLIVWYL